MLSKRNPNEVDGGDSIHDPTDTITGSDTPVSMNEKNHSVSSNHPFMDNAHGSDDTTEARRNPFAARLNKTKNNASGANNANVNLPSQHEGSKTYNTVNNTVNSIDSVVDTNDSNIPMPPVQSRKGTQNHEATDNALSPLANNNGRVERHHATGNGGQSTSHAHNRTHNGSDSVITHTTVDHSSFPKTTGSVDERHSHTMNQTDNGNTRSSGNDRDSSILLSHDSTVKGEDDAKLSEPHDNNTHQLPSDTNKDDGNDVMAGINALSESEHGGSWLDEDDEEDNSKPKKLPWIVAIVVLILLVAGVGAGVWFSTHDTPVKLDNSSRVSGSKINTGGDNSSDDTSNPANKEKQFLESIGVPKFYQQDKDSLSKEQVADANEYALATEPQNAVGRFMSKDSNPDLTDDPSQYLLKDGSINPNYSYLTADNTTAVIRDDMERLVNPVYGGWDFLQSDIRQDFDGYAQPFDSLSIADMFDPSVPLANEADVRANAKLYADWDSNSYGGEWKNLESPIVGQIVDYNCDYNVAGSEGDTISCTAQVKYTGKVKNDDGKIQDKSVDKTLKLNYKVVYEDTNTSSRRILLTSVEQ